MKSRVRSDRTVTKGEQTTQAITSAAYELILRQGYAATSMRQIAEKAGLALGSIYNHFSSKEEVFEAILLERHPMVQIVPIMRDVEANTVEEFARKAGRGLVEQLGRHPEFVNLMLTEIVEFRGSHMKTLFKKMLPIILQIANRLGKLDGPLRPNLSTPVMIRAFAGTMLFYFATETLIGPGIPSAMRTNNVDPFVDIFLHGILAEEAA